MKHNILQTIKQFILSVGKQFMLNQIQLYLTKLYTKFFYMYPALYKVMDVFFTFLATFYSYLYSIGFTLHNKFKNDFPILYSISLYIYSEYLDIMNGNLSRNMEITLGLYVVFYYSHFNLILYSLLILNALIKKHLIKDTWLKVNFPVLFKVLLDISSLINTIFIFYFLDLIFINLIKPFLFKVWNGILKMANGEDNNSHYSDQSEGNLPKKPELPEGYYYDKNGKKTKRRSKPTKPMSELSPEEQKIRRDDNRKYKETQKAKKKLEREKFEKGQLNPEEEKAYSEKLEKAQAEAIQNQINFHAKNPHYHKEQYIEHKDSKKERSSQYYEDHKEAQKETQKNYRLNNKDSIKKRQREYRLENREEINEKKIMDYNVKTGMWDNEKIWKDHPNKKVKFIPKEKTPEILDEQPLDKGKA